MPHYCTLPVKTNLCLVSDNHDDRLFQKAASSKNIRAP